MFWERQCQEMSTGMGEWFRGRDKEKKPHMRRLFSQSRCHVDLTTKGEAERGGEKRSRVRRVIQTSFSTCRASDSWRTNWRQKGKIRGEWTSAQTDKWRPVERKSAVWKEEKTDSSTELGCHEKTLEMSATTMARIVTFIHVATLKGESTYYIKVCL